MAASITSKVIRLTADNDTYNSGGVRLKIKGVRLVTAAADSTAQIRETDSNGGIAYSLTALAKTVDESNICVDMAGIIHADISGAGAEVFVYVE
jgi:hypothetical protein